MKRYFDLEDFITFLKLLEEGKITKLYTESLEDGSINEHSFLKVRFKDSDAILYDNVNTDIGLISDSYLGTWEEDAKIVFEVLKRGDEYKLFIEG